MLHSRVEPEGRIELPSLSYQDSALAIELQGQINPGLLSLAGEWTSGDVSPSTLPRPGLVEPVGVEPTTFAMPWRRSPN